MTVLKKPYEISIWEDVVKDDDSAANYYKVICQLKDIELSLKDFETRGRQSRTFTISKQIEEDKRIPWPEGKTHTTFTVEYELRQSQDSFTEYEYTTFVYSPTILDNPQSRDVGRGYQIIYRGQKQFILTNWTTGSIDYPSYYIHVNDVSFFMPIDFSAKYLQEQKIAVIGSDTMDSSNKAFSPVLTQNVNGETTLTFSMAYTYFNPDTESEVINPLIYYMINERKVKLKYDDKWYDFIIKNHEENSETNVWTFTASDAFVNELSKVGYNIEFSSELNNNQGTARELATRTLEHTDWTVAADSDNLRQTTDEPLYQCTVTNNFEALNVDTNETVTVGGQGDNIIYIFYSFISNKDTKFVEFLRESDRNSFTYDDNNVIIGTNYRIKTPVTYITDASGNVTSIKLGNTTIITVNSLYTANQGKKVVYKQLTTYDPVMERTVDVYALQQNNKVAKDIYDFKDFEYTTSDVVQSFVTNGSNFNIYENGTLQGWDRYTYSSDREGGLSKLQELDLVTEPELDVGKRLVPITGFTDICGFLKMQFLGYSNQGGAGRYYHTFFNSGIKDHLLNLDHITKGESYILRVAANRYHHSYVQTSSDLIPYIMNNEGIRAVIAGYNVISETSSGKTIYVKQIDTSNIIMDFTGQFTELNNKITGGSFNSSKTKYTLNGVIVEPSTKCIYKVDNDSNDYVWDTTLRRYRQKTNMNFTNFYYTTATAQRSLSNEELQDAYNKSSGGIGIFVYTDDSTIVGTDYYIYLSDIEITKDYRDAQGIPVTIGNIPQATTHTTHNYYVKPEAGTKKEKVEIFSSIPEIASALGCSQSSIKPVYNENSEKILSISEAQSNCFNILQTICETFECWLDINVTHDADGAIALDADKHPIKTISLRNYAGKDNLAGFKYGINLKSIQRTLNSDEIVTKLIVDNVQNDYVDGGTMSIRDAKTNPSGEAYILNFNYYFNKQLFENVEDGRTDLTNFYVKMLNYNQQLNQLRKEKNDIDNSLVKIRANRTVYSELISAATETYNKAKDTFKNGTGGASYDDYVANRTSLKDKIGDVTKCESLLQTVGEMYMASSTINNYRGLLDNLNKEYTDLNLKSNGAEDYTITVSRFDNKTTVVINDYIEGITCALATNSSGANETRIVSNLNQKVFEFNNTYEYFKIIAIPDNYISSDTTLNTYIQTHSGTQSYSITPNLTFKAQYPGYKNKIAKLQEEKDLYEQAFYTKYSNYIKEGTWSSNEYIDPELYYLDAVQVSNTSAMPKVEYSIDVAEVSELEDLKDYEFAVGDKSYVEDPEFFGWAAFYVNKSDGTITYNYPGASHLDEYEKGLTPAREEVIVSQVEWHLDEPENNVVTVQNYKTRFEDLFQRIGATVQTVQYNEATYAKTTSFLDANGTINQNVLLASLNSIGGNTYALTSDGSIKILDGECIFIQNKENAAKQIKINGTGIQISSDGGQSWSTAIDGSGINVNKVITGTLNTREIIILNGDKPSFRWDSSGISAFKQLTNDPDNLQYDLHTYVRFDQYGVYGIDRTKMPDSFSVNTLEEIEDNAQFGLTWHGFFIKSSYTDGGGVSITSDNDFQVKGPVYIDPEDPTAGEEIGEVIKIGALEWAQGSGTSTEKQSSTHDVTITLGAAGSPTATNNYILEGAPNQDGVTITTSSDNVTYEKVVGAWEYDITNEGDTEETIHFYYVTDDAPILYGIRIRNKKGEPVFITDQDGNITITGTIDALGGNFDSLVTVGKNDIGMPYIAIDGRTTGNTLAQMYSSNYYDNPGSGWMINTEGDAVFNNITARGAIKTAVFEYAEIQAVGGVFLFRPSSTIKQVISYDDTTLKLKVDNAKLFQKGDWCKLSNYTTDGNIADDPSPALEFNGFSHVYEVKRINAGENTVTLNANGNAVMSVIDKSALIGGALVSFGNRSNAALFTETFNTQTGSYSVLMHGLDKDNEQLLIEFDDNEYICDRYGNENSTVLYGSIATLVDSDNNNNEAYIPNLDFTEYPFTIIINGNGNAGEVNIATQTSGNHTITIYSYQEQVMSNNYGIGINSSDNTVALPARTIALFETEIHPESTAKITYNYKDVLGTLPELPWVDPLSQSNDNKQVATFYHNYMVGTQGIYTDNMYIGDKDHYIGFYNDGTQKKLVINTTDFLLDSGTPNTDNYIYINNNDGASKIIGTSGSRLDWRIIAGNKFGVTKGGELYAEGAKLKTVSIYDSNGNLSIIINANGFTAYKTITNFGSVPCVTVDSNGLSVYHFLQNQPKLLARYDSSIAFYDYSGNKRVDVNTGGLDIYNGDTQIAHYGSDIIIGNETSGHMKIGSNLLQLYTLYDNTLRTSLGVYAGVGVGGSYTYENDNVRFVLDSERNAYKFALTPKPARTATLQVQSTAGGGIVDLSSEVYTIFPLEQYEDNNYVLMHVSDAQYFDLIDFSYDPLGRYTKILSLSYLANYTGIVDKMYLGHASFDDHSIFGVSGINNEVVFSINADQVTKVKNIDVSTYTGYKIDGLSMFYTRTNAGDLSWTSTDDSHKQVIAKSALGFWNGAYSGTSSNLSRCADGRIIGGNSFYEEGYTSNINITAGSTAGILVTKTKTSYYPLVISAINITSGGDKLAIQKYKITERSRGSVTFSVTLVNPSSSSFSNVSISVSILWVKIA